MSDEQNFREEFYVEPPAHQPAKYFVVDMTDMAPDGGVYCTTPEIAMDVARSMAAAHPHHYIDIYHHSHAICARPENSDADG